MREEITIDPNNNKHINNIIYNVHILYNKYYYWVLLSPPIELIIN